jgi:hypothetical protein
MLDFYIRMNSIFEHSDWWTTSVGRLTKWSSKREDGVHWLTVLESSPLAVVQYGCDSEDHVSNRAEAFFCPIEELDSKLLELGL